MRALFAAIALFGSALALSACGDNREHNCWDGYPRQCAAEQLVWGELLGHTEAPPPITWRAYDCPGGFMQGDQCLAGVFVHGGLDSDRRIDLVWGGSFSASPFAHELLHAHHWTQGIDDGTHARPEWREWLPMANRRLQEEGL